MNTSPSPKKPYLKPTLRVYGEIQQLTKTVGSGTMMDGPGAAVKTG